MKRWQICPNKVSETRKLMLAEASEDVQSGRLADELHLPATAKLELVEFIAQELPRWRDHPERPARHTETVLTEHLCDHLNSAAYFSPVWSHVQFRTETVDETHGGRKIDLTVKPRAACFVIEGRRHTQFDALLPVECKRMPTPKENNRDEREYVVTDRGSTGGIQRFKFGYHGASHNFAAMIAYVQERSFSQWLATVNGWIHDLSQEPGSLWTRADALRQFGEDPNARLFTLASRHERPEQLGDCELRHLWIAMH